MSSSRWKAGYGVTLGNAMRRVLLSSLPGAAITSIRIDGVYHEFSSIPHVKEDITVILLNVKSIRLRWLASSDNPVRLYVQAEGEGVITAGDIECPSGVEIVNPGPTAGHARFARCAPDHGTDCRAWARLCAG